MRDATALPARAGRPGEPGAIPGLARNREARSHACPRMHRGALRVGIPGLWRPMPSEARSTMQRRPPRRRACGAVRSLLAFAVLACAAGCERTTPSAPPPDSEPRRIVPASATAVDFVTELVEPERIAALPAQAAEYSRLVALEGALAGTPRFEAYLAEPVLAQRPDLVVVDPWQAPDTTARLRRAGVAVFALPEIHTWEAARAALLQLGGVLRAPARAEELAGELDRRVARLTERAAARAGLRALCYSNFGASGWSAGSQTSVHEILRLAGLRNAVAEAGRVGHVGLGFEALLVLDPDLIVVSRPLAMPAGAAGDRGGASEAVLTAEPSLAGLRAVRERRIVSLPAWLYATGSHEMVRAAEVLADEVDALQRRLEAAPAGEAR